MKIINEIERDAPLTNVEKAALGLFALWPILAIIAIGALCSGCSSTPTGVRVVASSATATNIGDIAWDEYKIPVFSVYTGPTIDFTKNERTYDRRTACLNRARC